MLKKILCLTLVLMMLIPVGSALAQDFSEISADVISKSVADLNNLQVMVGDTNGDFRGESNITRAEFSVILCRIAGIEEQAKSYYAGTSFSDVENHWAKGYIEIAKQYQFINGFPDGSFRPQENVTVAQAVKMLVCLLGYEDQMVKTQGFPYGYTLRGDGIGLSFANGKEISRDYLSAKNGLPATRNFVAFLVSNALDVPLRDWVSSNGMSGAYQQIEYITYDGKDGRDLKTLRIKNYDGKR